MMKYRHIIYFYNERVMATDWCEYRGRKTSMEDILNKLIDANAKGEFDESTFHCLIGGKIVSFPTRDIGRIEYELKEV